MRRRATYRRVALRDQIDRYDVLSWVLRGLAIGVFVGCLIAVVMRVS